MVPNRTDEGGTELWDKNSFMAGDQVIKTGGDYLFEGVVVSIFWTIRKKKRYVVENQDGILLIFRESQLVRR